MPIYLFNNNSTVNIKIKTYVHLYNYAYYNREIKRTIITEINHKVRKNQIQIINR